MRPSMRCALIAASTIIASYAIAGCSNDDPTETVEYKPPDYSEKPKGRDKSYVSGADEFARRLAKEQARKKAKAGKK